MARKKKSKQNTPLAEGHEQTQEQTRRQPRQEPRQEGHQQFGEERVS